MKIPHESLCIQFMHYTVGLWGVVNNAAIERVLDIELVPIEQMKKLAEVNFYGMVRVTKAFIPMIRKSKGNCL